MERLSVSIRVKIENYMRMKIRKTLKKSLRYIIVNILLQNLYSNRTKESNPLKSLMKFNKFMFLKLKLLE